MAFNRDLFLATVLNEFSSTLEQRDEEARKYKQQEEVAYERNIPVVQQRVVRGQQAAQIGKKAMQLGASQAQVRTAMSSGMTGVSELYEKLQAAANQRGVKKLGVDDIEAIVNMPVVPGVNETLADKTLEQFAMETYGAVGKAAPQEDRGGFFASLLDPRGRVKQQLRDTNAFGGMSMADVNAAARNADYRSLFPESTVTYTDMDFFTSEIAYDFSTKMTDVANKAVKTDAAEAYIKSERMKGNSPEERQKLEAAARREIAADALEPLIEYYADTYQHGGFFQNTLAKRAVIDTMGQEWWDDFSSAYAQQSPEEEDEGEGKVDQTSQALGMTPMPEGDVELSLPPTDMKYRQQPTPTEDQQAAIEQFMSGKLIYNYNTEYTREQWDKMSRKDRKARGLPESVAGAARIYFRDELDAAIAEGEANMQIKNHSRSERFKIRIKGRGTFNVTKEQLDSMTDAAFRGASPAIEIIEYGEGEEKVKNIPSSLLKRYQVGE